ncbi:MAG TPA: hypothetical protein VN408_27410 [Actinoplanes sp.]|nr:hypothetical protein [Actinoplanes sp.]
MLWIWQGCRRTATASFAGDLGTESLTVLTNKIINDVRLAEVTRWRWPVLFWLPSTRRELDPVNP